jgi:isopentenyldiphosphate isomerase
LQKRSKNKDIQPGKWDTSVGGHLRPGENSEAGARRELNEELGIAAPPPLVWLYQYEMKSSVETELVDTFSLTWAGEVFPDPGEIDEGRWWEPEEIRRHLGCEVFTPNFEEEYQRWQAKTGGHT